MNRMVWWNGLDQWRAEVSEIDLGSGRLSASGVQIGVDPLPYRLDYAVVTSSAFVTEAIRVIVKGAGWHRRLDLRRDTSGQWSCDVENSGAADLPAPGGDMSAVGGALDCDLGRSPSTNTMPIRRHNLHREPGAVDFFMAWVSVPDLSVHPSRGSADPLWKVYREGIVVNVLNPKVALFFLAFLPQFVDTNSEPAAVQIIVLGLVMSLMGMASNIVYALTGGALHNLLERRSRFLQAQRYVTGTVYLGLGAAAALAGETRR